MTVSLNTFSRVWFYCCWLLSMTVSCVIRTLVTDNVIRYLVSKTRIGFWCSLGNQWHFVTN